jgi:hypothetical protein
LSLPLSYPALQHVQVGNYVEYRCKAQIAAQTATEAGIVEVDNRPWSRHGYTMCKHLDMFYLFGGTIVKEGKKTNNLYWLSMNTMNWHLQTTQGARPAPRAGHCAVCDPETDRMIVFGGRGQVGPHFHVLLALSFLPCTAYVKGWQPHSRLWR